MVILDLSVTVLVVIIAKLTSVIEQPDYAATDARMVISDLPVTALALIIVKITCVIEPLGYVQRDVNRDLKAIPAPKVIFKKITTFKGHLENDATSFIRQIPLNEIIKQYLLKYRYKL